MSEVHDVRTGAEQSVKKVSHGLVVGDISSHRDNIDLPFRDPKTKKPSEVKVKIPFTNPVIVGKFPYHCHILEHEDGGMMGNLRVIAAP